MAALIPIGLTALGAIPGLISGIMGIANEAKKLQGGRLRRLRRVLLRKRIAHPKKRGGKLVISRYARSGRGPIADTLSQIPLLGMIAGPIARAFGGRRGRGFSPMYLRREFGAGMLTPPGGHMVPYQKQLSIGLMPLAKMLGMPAPTIGPMPRRRKVGIGLLAPAGGRIVHRKGYYKYVNGKRVHVAPTIVHAGGKAKKRGGKLVHRKGYYKYVNGKRVHVAATTVHTGGKIKRKAHKKKRGGYIPYQWRMRSQYY